jgi:hypothetical protein
MAQVARLAQGHQTASDVSIVCVIRLIEEVDRRQLQRQQPPVVAHQPDQRLFQQEGIEVMAPYLGA